MSDELKDSSPAKEEKDAASDEEPMEAEVSKEDTADTSKEAEDHNESKDDDGEEEEEESDEEEHEKLKPGLLEKPYVLAKGSKRERKKVERLSFQSAEKAEKKQEIEDGRGDAIGDIPYAEFKLSRTKAEDLKPLHRVLFGRTGSALMVKKNIRKFSGFAFEKDDPMYEKKENLLKGKTYPIALLKTMCEVLNVPRGGTKNEIIDNLLSFLLKPEDSGRKVPTPKRKRKSKGDGEKKKKRKSSKKKAEKPKKKAKKESDDEDDDDDEEEEEEDVDKSEEEEVEEEKEDEKEDSESAVSDSDSEVEAPPKKKVKKNTPKAKPTPKAKAKPKEKTKEKKEAKPKKEKTKTSPKKKPEPEDLSDISSSSSDDDEPLIKKKANGPPTNEELKEAIKKMLDSADLEEVTMKTVLKSVNAKYPSHDLSDRKEFIKNTVKQIIS